MMRPVDGCTWPAPGTALALADVEGLAGQNGEPALCQLDGPVSVAFHPDPYLPPRYTGTWLDESSSRLALAHHYADSAAAIVAAREQGCTWWHLGHVVGGRSCVHYYPLAGQDGGGL